MRSLTYSRPSSLSEAVQILRNDPQAKALAGGQTLLPALKLRLSAPSRLVDLQGIDELRGLAISGSRVTVGAMTSHAELAGDASVKRLAPALSAVAAGIGDRMVRNMGTLGGSIANNDPAADYPAVLLGLNAIVITTSRRIAACDFFRNLYETALAGDELVKAVEFPATQRAAYVKFKNPASRFALIGVFAADTEEGVRVTVTGAGSMAFRITEYEQALTENFKADAIDGIAAEFGSINSDIHASDAYRRSLIPELARRAIQRALHP